MDFLTSPVHNYNFETFDDGFFDLPKEMDFELNDELKDNMSYSIDDEDDLNNGMYGVWSTKHPWSLNNSSNSMYSSNLHLDFIGGDPESAIMVNPNIVIPSGFQLADEESVKIEGNDSERSPSLPRSITLPLSSLKKEPIEESTTLNGGISIKNEEESVVLAHTKKQLKSKFASIKENLTFEDELLPHHVTTTKPNTPKIGVRVLKPAAIIDSSNNSANAAAAAGTITSANNQLRNATSAASEIGAARLKGAAALVPTSKTSLANGSPKCASSAGFYYQNETFYPKPAFSYSCLIAMALKNSKHGCLPVAEIYNFMCNHFPYFKTAPNGWKNSVRHNLSLNKCFEKIEKPAGSTQRKGCLWALNPNKAAKLEDEVQKWTKKDAAAIKRAMEYPEHLELLERGELKSLYDTEQNADEDEDDMDTNEEDDTEPEEQNGCDEDTADEERLSEVEDLDSAAEKRTKEIVGGSGGAAATAATGQAQQQNYPVLNIAADNDLPEFNIEVDGSIYEELIGSIENDQLFTINSQSASSAGNGGATTKAANAAAITPESAKKVNKFFIAEVKDNTVVAAAKSVLSRNKGLEPEIYDHYDINNLLRFESENKASIKKRFNTKRICNNNNSRIKQIKFKTWN